MELDIFADQGDCYILCRMLQAFDHLFPVFQIRFRTVKLQAFAYNGSEMFFFHGEWCFVKVFHIQVLKNVIRWHVTEESDLVFDYLIQWMLRTADKNIRLDSNYM